MAIKRRVLIVDDDSMHRETLSMLLTSGGIQVVGCESGHDALALLQQREQFDLILSDVVMPGMDGMEFARAARRLCSDVPIVLVTGRESAMDAIVSDGNVALLKPYSTTTLNSVLLEHLGITV
jgi:CheY-like chemotaxis protein